MVAMQLMVCTRATNTCFMLWRMIREYVWRSRLALKINRGRLHLFNMDRGRLRLFNTERGGLHLIDMDKGLLCMTDNGRPPSPPVCLLLLLQHVHVFRVYDSSLWVPWHSLKRGLDMFTDQGSRIFCDAYGQSTSNTRYPS